MCQFFLLCFAQLAVLGAWFLAYAVLLGFGSALNRLIGVKTQSPRLLVVAVLNGVTVVTFLALLLNFWFPLGPCGKYVLALGAIGLAWNWRALAECVGRLARQDRPSLLAAALVTLWLSNRALGPAANDTLSYHWSTIRYAATYPLIPGLGNLGFGFAGNNSNLAAAALLETGPWTGRSNHVFNGIFVLLLFLQAMPALATLLRRPAGVSPGAVFRALMVVPAFHFAINIQRMTSFYGDVPVAALALTSAGLVLDLLQGGFQAERSRLLTAISVCASLACAATMKQTALVFAFCGWCLVMAMMFRERSFWPAQKWRGLAWSLLLSVALLSCWFARGVGLSGYLLYPLKATGVPVDWRVPAPKVEAERINNMLQTRSSDFRVMDAATARHPWEWIRPWSLRYVVPHGDMMPLPAAVAVAGLCWAAFGARRAPGQGRPRAWWLMLPVSLGLVVWFVKFPDVRYGFFLWWGLAGLAWAIALCYTPAALRAACSKAVRSLVILGLLVNLLRLLVGYPVRFHIPLAKSFEAVVLFGPGDDHGFHKQSPPHVPGWQRLFGRAACRLATNACGVVLHVPQLGHRLGDAPLPAAQAMDNDVRYRVGNDFRRGFTCQQARPTAGPAKGA